MTTAPSCQPGAPALAVLGPRNSGADSVRSATRTLAAKAFLDGLATDAERHVRELPALRAMFSLPELQDLRIVGIRTSVPDVGSIVTLECRAEYGFFVWAKNMLETLQLEDVGSVVSFRESDWYRDVVLELPEFEIQPLLRISRNRPIFT